MWSHGQFLVLLTDYFWCLAQSRTPACGLAFTTPQESRFVLRALSPPSQFQIVTSWDECPADSRPPEREADLLLRFHQKNEIQGPGSRIRFPKPGRVPFSPLLARGGGGGLCNYWECLVSHTRCKFFSQDQSSRYFGDYQVSKPGRIKDNLSV